MRYIEAVSNIVISPNAKKAPDQLSDAQNQLLLVGSAEVVTKLMVFHDYLKLSNSQNRIDNRHDELLTDLLKRMRTDLYKKKNVNLNYPIIHLTGQASKK